jgi:hypothetical protein
MPDLVGFYSCKRAHVTCNRGKSIDQVVILGNGKAVTYCVAKGL